MDTNPLGLQRCTERGSHILISHRATRIGIFTPRWSTLLLPCLFGGRPISLSGCSQLQGLSWLWVPWSPTAGTWSWAQTGQTDPDTPLPSGICIRRVTAAPGLRGSRWCFSATSPPPVHLCRCGTEAAAQLTVGRDWIQFLINRSVPPIHESLVSSCSPADASV